MVCYLLPQPTRDLVGSQDTSSRNHLQNTRSPNHIHLSAAYTDHSRTTSTRKYTRAGTRNTPSKKGTAKNTLLCRGGCRSSTLQGTGTKCAAQLTKDPHGEGSVLQRKGSRLASSLRRQQQLQGAQHMRCMYTGSDGDVQGRVQGWVTPRPPLNQSQGSCDQDSGNNMLLGFKTRVK
jgi:hypothetical protein